MEGTLQDKDFLEFVIKSIVGNPDKVSVDRIVDERGVLLTLSIDPADMGYVIGRGGQTAQAVRTLLKIVGAKNNARVNLKINEPEGSTRPPRREYSDNRENRDTRDSASVQRREDIDTSSVDDFRI